MTCRITGCPGTYETIRRGRTIHRKGELLVIQHVPAEVCDVCDETLSHEETVRRLEAMAHDPGTPVGRVPLYEYARRRAGIPDHPVIGGPDRGRTP
jgi:YgiT-type zinc finger domain-containing protein